MPELPWAYYNKSVVILYRVRLGSATGNKKKTISSQWKVLRQGERVPFFKAVYCLAYWGLAGIIKYKFYK